jgi:hypothetical protein
MITTCSIAPAMAYSPRIGHTVASDLPTAGQVYRKDQSISGAPHHRFRSGPAAARDLKTSFVSSHLEPEQLIECAPQTPPPRPVTAYHEYSTGRRPAKPSISAQLFTECDHHPDPSRSPNAGRNCRAVITSKPCATGSMGCGVIVARDLYGDGTDQKASQYLGIAIDQPCGCRVALPGLIGAFTSVTTRQPGAF